MAKVPGQQVDEAGVPLRLTVARHRALQATARGEVYRTHSGIAYTLTGPCGSAPLWALARADLIADPPEARQHGRHRMVLTAKGRAALELTSSTFEPNKKP
ncbi:hypothetical protein IVB30_14870 [Bradyrhizobium sp. 200]|uniref:hypothetical protein n=1 Tax=Bradyrhizobium sp. 200 TaxID=2782665 RepID=UPI001FFF1302|nr:hypothetical protein [Bradyrhizobium sp. 200]UPJ52513.1 hypothetical protein IVB30_14870 [Bradyrhizobium sp. 200]